MSVSPITEYRTPRGVGRPSADDVEAQSPAGRWLHQLESRVFGIAATCIKGRAAHPLWLQHDALCDATVGANEAIGCRLLDHPDPEVRDLASEIVGNCAVYWRVDASEDACTAGLFGLLAEIHEAAKRIGAWIEKSCTAIRSRQ